VLWHTPLSSGSPFRVDVRGLAVGEDEKPGCFAGGGDFLEKIHPRLGQPLWRTHLGSWTGEAVLVRGVLVVCCVDRLRGLDPETGTIRWNRPLRPGDLRPGSFSVRDYPFLFPGRDSVALVSRLGKAMGFSAENGEPKWEATLGKGFCSAALQDPSSGRVAAFFPGTDAFRVFDPDVGEAGKPLPGVGRPLAAGGDRVVLLEKGRRETTVSLRPLAEGKPLWKASVPGLYEEGRVDPAEGLVLLTPVPSPAPPSPVRALDLASGAIRWSIPMDRRPFAHHLHGDLFFLLRGGRDVQAFSTDSGNRVWSARVPDAEPRSALWEASAFALALCTVGGDVVLLDRKTGSVLGRLRLDRGKIEGFGHVGAAGLLVRAERGSVFLGPPESPEVFLPLLGRDGEEDPFLLNRLYVRSGKAWRGVAETTFRLWKRTKVHVDPFDPDYRKLRAVVEGAAFLVPRVVRARRFQHPPKMDGELDEPWSEADAVPLSLGSVRFLPDPSPRTAWGGEGDLSATLYTGWDEKAFYIALDLTDDRPMVRHDDTVQRWTGDVLFFALDRMGDGGFRQGRDDDVNWVFWPKERPEDRPPPPRRKEDQAQNRAVKGKEGRDGMVVEMAFPWEDKFNNFLRRYGLRAGLIRPRPGVGFGFNLLVLDDDGAGPTQYLALAPGLSLTKSRRRPFQEGFWPALWTRIELR
jgi:outer membrane protein assembly factor BamB